jgi:ankyrin repeat protein
VEALLKAGANVDAADNGGNTALMGACFKGYPDVANVLISNGANLNAQHGNGGTALMFAAMFGRNNLVDLLIEKGADKNIRPCNTTKKQRSCRKVTAGLINRFRIKTHFYKNYLQ